MNKWIAGIVVGLITASFTLDADAQRRLGGGRNLGQQSPQVQRQAAPPSQQAPQAAPAQPNAQQAAPTKAPAATPPAAARPASPWRGALMGLAAGLGIAALASYLGLSEQLAMLMTVVLIGLLLVLVVGFVMRRLRGPQPAFESNRSGARGPGTYTNMGYETAPMPREPSPVIGGTARPGSVADTFARQQAVSTPWGVPADFNTSEFLAHARENFIRLQHAWDSGNLDEIAEFTTNDMFITLTHELRARAGHSKTEVVALDATLLGIESNANEHVASVKFDGTLRVDGEIERVSEVWNLSKPARGGSGWVLAGIQQFA